MAGSHCWFAVVLHLLQDHNQDAIPEKWVPNDTINHYVREWLGFEARATNRFAKASIERSRGNSHRDIYGIERSRRLRLIVTF